jgi:hypothetical protein
MIDSACEAQICQLPLAALEDLSEALLDFSDVVDMMAWLQAQQENSRST